MQRGLQLNACELHVCLRRKIVLPPEAPVLPGVAIAFVFELGVLE